MRPFAKLRLRVRLNEVRLPNPFAVGSLKSGEDPV